MCNEEKKYVTLLFRSLITRISEALGVQFEGNDERIKNEGAITVRAVERIAGESTIAATPERPAITRIEQTIEIENMLQELSKAVKVYVQAQMEENKRF